MSSIALGHNVAHRPRVRRPAAPAGDAVRPSRMTFLWRRALVLSVLLSVVFAMVAGVANVAAGADAGPRETATVTVEPGETLWDVAVETAPDGVDPRRQLAEIRELNSVSPADLRAWSVVLVPA